MLNENILFIRLICFIFILLVPYLPVILHFIASVNI